MEDPTCLFFLFIGIVYLTVYTWVNNPNENCRWWPFTTLVVFIFSKLFEFGCSKSYFGIIFIIGPVNFWIFGYGVWIYLNFFPDIFANFTTFAIISLIQTLQVIFYFYIYLIVLWTCKWSFDPYGSERSRSISDSLLGNGLEEVELKEVLKNKPVDLEKLQDSTWSIWLFNIAEQTTCTELLNWKHIFHQDWIKKWLKMEHRWPNCNSNVREFL